MAQPRYLPLHIHLMFTQSPWAIHPILQFFWQIFLSLLACLLQEILKFIGHKVGSTILLNSLSNSSLSTNFLLVLEPCPLSFLCILFQSLTSSSYLLFCVAGDVTISIDLLKGAKNFLSTYNHRSNFCASKLLLCFNNSNDVLSHCLVKWDIISNWK